MQVSSLAHRLARRLPPPAIMGLPFRLAPVGVQRLALERLLNSHLEQSLADGEFDFLEGHALAVEVRDMRLRWVFGCLDRRLILLPLDARADASIAGRAVDFLLLLSREEDPDTMFFQRRLEVTGDTTIGLTTRNLLDRLCWEDLPLGLRLVLNRAGRFARTLHEARAPDSSPPSRPSTPSATPASA